jgi:hypothetical protein
LGHSMLHVFKCSMKIKDICFFIYTYFEII